MFGTSMLFTVGQALDHAQTAQARVRLCVGGEWITGQVLHTDGHGLVVADENGDTCVIRMEAVSCVRIPAAETERADEPERRVPAQATHALGQG